MVVKYGNDRVGLSGSVEWHGMTMEGEESENTRDDRSGEFHVGDLRLW